MSSKPNIFNIFIQKALDTARHLPRHGCANKAMVYGRDTTVPLLPRNAKRHF